MTRRPAPTLLLLAGAASGGLGLLTELARTLGHQVAPAGAAAARLGSWFSTGDRIAIAEPDLLERFTDYGATADRLGAAFPVLILVEHPTAADPRTWLHSVLGAAQVTRGRARSAIRAEDLRDDWQATLLRADKESGSRLLAEATLAQLDDADDLVRTWPPAPGPDWSRHAVDPALRDLAARSWQVLGSVADGFGDLDLVDSLWAEYAAEFGAAS